MARLSLKILPSQKGKLYVKVAVAHNGQTRYIATDVFVDNLGQFINGTVVNRPDAAIKNIALSKILMRYQEALLSLEYTNGLTCSEIVSLLRNDPSSKSNTLEQVFAEYLGITSMKPATLLLTKNNFNSIIDYFGYGKSISSFKFIDVMGYDKHLKNIGNSNGTIISKMTVLRKILNFARRAGYPLPNADPFEGYRLPEPGIRESWLTVEEIKTLRDSQLVGKPANKMRDYVMLSYYLGGINAVDLLSINFDEVKKRGVIKYQRTKTIDQKKINKYVEFAVPDEAWELIDKLKSKDGYLGTLAQRGRGMHYYFSHAVEPLREQTGLANLIYYSARKSFSQHAFELGIPTSIIDFILGHKLNKGGTSLYNYISVTPEMATDAIRKVLDNLK